MSGPCASEHKRPFVFVTGPYSAPTKEEVEHNIQRAIEMGRIVLHKGYYPIVPHLLVREYYDPENDSGIFGYESLMQHITRGHTMFPDFQMTVEDIVAEDDKVTCRATMTGTHLGKVMGIAPTGKKVSVSNIGIMRFKDGKVIESWGIHDGLSMWHQLGVAPTGLKSDSK